MWKQILFISSRFEMRAKSSRELAERVCHFFQNVFSRNRKDTVKHFYREGIARFSISRILDRFEVRGTAEYKKPPGRPPRLATKKVIKTVKKAFQDNPNISEGAVARKVGLSSSFLHKIKVDKLNMKTYKSMNAPKYTNEKKSRAKTNCRKIVEKMLSSDSSKIIVMDDETYCPVDPESINGVKYYTCRNKQDVEDKFKFHSREKFPKKYLVWLAFDENGGVSNIYVTTKSMDSKLYLTECIKKRMIPFVKNRNVLFLPDMATCHYVRNVTDFLRAKKVDFVEKKDNAPNVPQVRPIERFWALCKKEYARRKKPAKNIDAFRRVWKQITKKVAETSGETLMEHVRQKIRTVVREGVYGPLNAINM